MPDQPPPLRTSSGQEAQDALRAVMQDQVDRRQKQSAAAPKPRGPGAAPQAAAMILALVSALVWISPPSMLEPRPIPPPLPIVQESGLRMDLYMVAVQILRFQETMGRLPITAPEAVFDPIEADEFEYVARGRDLFQLSASRDGHVVVYSSDQSLMDFASQAQLGLEGGNPGGSRARLVGPGTAEDSRWWRSPSLR